MARGLYKVDTGVDTVVDDVCPVNLVLGFQVGVVSLLDVLNNRTPRVIVVHKVTKTWCIDHGQTKTDAILLNIGADGLDGHGLGDDVVAGGSALLRGVERGVEQGVDESGLSETRFTCNHVSIHSCCQKASNSPTTMTLKLNPLRTLLRCH